MTRRSTLYAVAILFAALALAQVWCRPVDRDEGFWLYTSWRITEGDKLYRDFALPHMPLGPWYYAGLAFIFGPSLYALRFSNVVFTLAGGATLALAAHKRFGDAAGIFTFILYNTSSLTLTWLVPVKAYAPAATATALAVALWLWPTSGQGPPTYRAAAIGLALATATATRLTLLPTVLAPAGAFLFLPNRERLPRVIAAGAAFFLPLAAVGVHQRVTAGDAFTFNIWSIHKLFIGSPAESKTRLLGEVLRCSPDLLLLVLFAVAFFPRRHWPALSFPILLTAIIIIANLVPGTTQLQYFVFVVPALAVIGGAAAASFATKRTNLATAAVVLIAVVGACRPAAKVLADRAHKPVVGPAEVYAGASLIEEHTSPGETIFTAWPGYAALTRRSVLPGWELGYFTDRIGRRTNAETRRRYHLMTHEETAQILASGKITTAVTGIDADVTEAVTAVIRENFAPIAERRGVTVWKYRGQKKL